MNNNDGGFQIVCTRCGCLSIRIEEPLKATREEMVYCGDCGNSRGTVGALRDLSVRQYSDFVLSKPTVPSANGHTMSDTQPANEISKRYAELQRLRQRVEMAEWLARESNTSSIGRARRATKSWVLVHHRVPKQPRGLTNKTRRDPVEIQLRSSPRRPRLQRAAARTALLSARR